jgi:hypothetical protein
MASQWLVQVCCSACGTPVEAPLPDLPGRSALPCNDPACVGEARLPDDLVESARFLFEESRRRLAAR